MNNDKFSALMAMMTPDIISKIMDKYGLDENKAIALFHKSELYEALEKEDTQVWQYSSEMIVELFDRRSERVSGDFSGNITLITKSKSLDFLLLLYGTLAKLTK